MKSKLVIFLTLIFLFVIFIAVKLLVLDQQATYGMVKIISSPTASIFINNVFVGKTPFDDKYKIGEYLLKLIPDGNASDTASIKQKINIYKNAKTYVNQELGSSDINSAGEIFTTTKSTNKLKGSDYGEINVETDPSGSIVYLDNDEKGVAPMIIADVMKGEHELSVSMPGFSRRTQKINIDPGYRVNAQFKLAIDQTQKRIIPSPTVKDNEDASKSATVKKITITINDNDLGYLRVRESASITASESARVKPGEKFDLIEEASGWYKIEYEEGKEGWISSQYSTKKEQ